ncbi:MAG: hypothetical protein AAF629_01510 [Chloroflexota bacterium]
MLIFQWIFIVTTLWIGFILAISFMEAPLKFRAPSVTLPIGLEIGQLVFQMLNRIEGLFAVLTAISLFVALVSLPTVVIALVVIWIWVLQTWLLYTRLDPRAKAIIRGEPVGKTSYHKYYVGLELCKLILLCFLVYFQLQDFQVHLLSG